MRISTSWQSPLLLLVPLCAGLLLMDSYASSQLRRQALAADYNHLSALARVAQARMPDLGNSRAVAIWLSEMAASGARLTLLAGDGNLLYESEGPVSSVENYADEPEFAQAMAAGEGRSVRPTQKGNQEMVYLALRLPASRGQTGNDLAERAANSPVVLRIGLPQRTPDPAVAALHRAMWATSFFLLLFAGGAALLTSRSYARRIGQIEAFSNRVAEGDFRPLEMAEGRDGLNDLARALNRSIAKLTSTIRALTDESSRSAAILGSMIEGVTVVSAQERIVFSNRTFIQILGLADFPVEGRPLLEVVRHSDLLAIIRKALAGSQQLSSEIVVGTIRPRSFVVTASPVRTDGPSGAVLVLHEITELRRLERVRQDFVANISHEFRTPLTAIQGFAETLLSGALDDTANRRRFVEIIREHAARLARLTDDLLKLSRIEAGQLPLERRPVSVDQLIDACLETARFKAEQRQLSLTVMIPEGLPPMHADANRLREVLQNLVDNAMQYTPAGGEIEISAVETKNQVIVTVADTGIGIPEAEQPRIFERFYRVDTARSREVGGTGLGLSIARHIVEAHGGRLWVESSIGQGSRFHFSIPAVSAPALIQGQSQNS